jgi:hypothetical protein
MWLPETAVDLDTLDLLAQNGIQFTVLAPSQAASVDGEDVSGQRIDPTRAYRQTLPSGESIALFFYDGPISRSIAFEHLLNDGARFANRILDALNDQRDWAQLAHVATDGETYGHHHAHGDMALAYALEHFEQAGRAELTNYGQFLEKQPPKNEVQILENTAWSCVHGVGRWKENCGCNSGGHGDWNQEWRAPLRAALDWLRDEVAPRYEKMAARYLKDAWAARDGYIQVILDRSAESRERFIARYFRRKSTVLRDRITVWKLLEMQRHAMLMYTSCGWFFDELTGIETIQVMQYAGRVVQLAEELFGENLEAAFLERLALAKSNIAAHRDGAAIYEKFVKTAMVDLPKLAAHYALSSLFEDYREKAQIYCYLAEARNYQVTHSGRMRLAIGNARFTSEITQESDTFMFGVLHFGDHNLHGGVMRLESDEAYRELATSLQDAFARSDLAETIHQLDQGFSGHTYSLKNLFRDEQRKVLKEVLESNVEVSEASYQHMYDPQVPLLRFLSDCGVPIPAALRATAEIALNGRLRRALDTADLNLLAVQALLEEVRTAGIPLHKPELEMVLRRNLEHTARQFFDNPRSLDVLRKLRQEVEAARTLPLPLELWSIQNHAYAVRERVYPAMKGRAEASWRGEFDRLCELLHLHC